MVRNSLPQNFIKIPASVLDACNSGDTGWTIGGYSITLSADTTKFTSGTSSLKATTLLGSAGFNRFYKTADLNLNNSTYIEFDLYIDDNFSASSVYLFTDATNNNYYLKGINVADLVVNAWNKVRIYKQDFTVGGGTPDFNNIIKKIQFTIAPKTGTNSTINIDNITANQKSLPKCVFTFDDGYTSVYTEAFPYMQARGIKGTVFVISGSVGNNNYMTLAQLTELHNAGWIISNHTATHQHLAELTKAEQRVELQTCIDWLKANGFSDGTPYVAFPYGSYNQDTLDLCGELKIKIARTTTNGVNNVPFKSLLKLNNVAYDTTITVANLKSLYVDKHIYQGGTIIPMLHAIEASTTQTYNMSTANFQAMIGYHVMKKTDNVTIVELYRQLTYPRKSITRT